MPDQQQPEIVLQLRRQQAALAAFGGYAFWEPVLLNILNEATRLCAEGLGMPFCTIGQYREPEHDLLIEAGYGWNSGVVGQVTSQADASSPQGQAYTTGRPVIIQDLRAANHFVLPAFYGEHGVISTVGVIIKGLDGTPYGVLEIDSPVEHTYDQHDVDFLTGFANVLAEAVATAERNAMMLLAVKRMEAVVVEKDKLLAERVVLDQELKHRVRNNLQLVQGMLASHARNYPRADGKASVNAIIRRVTTLAEVYEQLLGTGMGCTINLGVYLKSLCASLPGLQREQNDRVELICVVEPLLADLDTVTAIGMVVAELVSNSLDHAFANASGTIRVSLQRSKQANEAVLIVGDDGIGFVERPGSKRHGVGLVRRLVQQLHGTANLHSNPGATWTLRFPTGAGRTMIPVAGL